MALGVAHTVKFFFADLIGNTPVKDVKMCKIVSFYNPDVESEVELLRILKPAANKETSQ